MRQSKLSQVKLRYEDLNDNHKIRFSKGNNTTMKKQTSKSKQTCNSQLKQEQLAITELRKQIKTARREIRRHRLLKKQAKLARKVSDIE